MSQDQQQEAGPEFLLGAWMRAATDFWGSVTKMWQPVFDTFQTPASSPKGDRGRPQEAWDSALKMWQALFSALSEPESAGSLFKGINALPEISLRMARTGWEGYFHLQQQWLQRVGRAGEQPEAYQFENLDENVFKTWIESYEKDFQQFLNIPQIGLARFYQERANRAVDKFNLFQIAAAEFLHLLYLPVEKSLRVMGEKLQELSKEGKLPENFKEYYNMWIKTLEGHYMTLSKSPEYTRALNKALNATEDFTVAKEELLTDALKSLPVPTSKDMDELYRELYLLNKKVKQLAKKVAKL